MAKYTSVVAGKLPRNQLRVEVSTDVDDGRTHAFTSASQIARIRLAPMLALAWTRTDRGRKGRRSGQRSPSTMMSGVSAAQPNHCGASPMNARQAVIGWPLCRANMTVSTVDRIAGIVQTA